MADLNNMRAYGFKLDSSGIPVSDNAGKFFSNLAMSLLGKYAGTNMTGSEYDVARINVDEAAKQRAWTEQMDNTKYQRSVQDMKDAGLNPGLMYGSAGAASAPSGSAASGSSAGAGSLSDIVNLLTLPAVIKNMNAQTTNLLASAKNTEAKTDTERLLQDIHRITIQFMPDMKMAELDNLLQQYENMVADFGVKQANKREINSRAQAQEIVNKYLDAQERNKLHNLIKEGSKLDADARLSNASAFFTEVQAQFAKKNGFLMSSSDALLVITYIADLLGISKENVKEVISKSGQKLKEFGSMYPDAASGMHD